MLTPEQRERRRRGIGSSDIPAIVGVSPHAAPIDAYLSKLGLSEVVETGETWCGDRAEGFIASLYEERADVGLRAEHPTTIVHSEHPWALATPDRWTDDGSPGGRGRIVELKLVGTHMLHLWRDGLPAHVEVQVQWQLEVCDVDRADVAALLGGTDFQVFTVERDRAKGAELLEVGRRFWVDHVLARVPPPHTGAQARALAQLRYPMSMGDMLPASTEAETLRRSIVKLREEEASLADARQRLESEAMAMIGNADGIDETFTWRRAGKTAMWRSAVRALFVERWNLLAEQMGDDERAWEMIARGLGAERLVDVKRGARRRFVVKRTKEERDGERAANRAGAIPFAPADGSEEDFQGALQAPGGIVPDEW